MPNFENTPSSTGAHASGVERRPGAEGETKPEEAISPEGLETPEAEGEGSEKPEPSTEQLLEDLEGEEAANQQEIAKLAATLEESKAQLNKAREQLGLPAAAEVPPSVAADESKLEELQEEAKELEAERKELVDRQEKERLIEEEKGKIMQEKLDELFKEFESMSSRDSDSVSKTGKKEGGGAMGGLDPETAKSLAKAFKEGIKMLPEILKALPGFLKKFDDELTKEAEERVEKKLEDEKKKMEEGEKPEEKEEKKEMPEGKAALEGEKPAQAGTEGVNVESPKI